MSTPEPNEHEFEQRLKEERDAGTVQRPLQTPATEGIEQSIDEERRSATGEPTAG